MSSVKPAFVYVAILFFLLATALGVAHVFNQHYVIATSEATPPEGFISADSFSRFESGDELAELHAAEKSKLSSFGWVDRKQKRVRIPIEDAINLMAAKLHTTKETTDR